jgi:16S rRNA (cytosine967-C5)-methyltransferase
VSRAHGRLEWRLRALSVSPTPRSLVLASRVLCAGESAATAVPTPTLTEAKWLSQLALPLEAEGMERTARLECPQWAWHSLLATFGEANIELQLRALQEAAPLDLRVNTLKATRQAALAAITKAGLTAAPTPHSPVGIRLASRAVALGTIPGLLDGVVDPQDEGSQLVALLLGARAGELVADYCAGAGGKTLAIAADMANRGKLYAMVPDEDRTS